jgi:hypothetical protein
MEKHNVGINKCKYYKNFVIHHLFTFNDNVRLTLNVNIAIDVQRHIRILVSRLHLKTFNHCINSKRLKLRQFVKCNIFIFLKSLIANDRMVMFMNAIPS